MKKNRIAVAALLCTMMITPLCAYPEDITDFSALKNAIENSDPVDIQNLGSAIQFESALAINKKVSISGNKLDNTASFSPVTPPSPPSPPEDPYTSPAFNVDKSGDLTLKYVNITDFGSTSAATIISNDGKLTIGPGVTFKDNKVSGSSGGGRPYPMGSGVISNSGEMIIETEENGDVTFEKVENGGKPNPDILFTGTGSLDITGEKGTVTFGNGITSNSGSSKPATDTKITHSGGNNVVLSGNNEKYTGTYTNQNGSLTFDKDGNTFFGGKSTFSGGELKWENNKDNAIVSGASLTVNGADLTVGNGTDTAKLTTADNVSIAGAKTITINSQGELALGVDTTFDATNGTNVKGEGKLSIEGKTLSLIGQVINSDADNLQFSSKNATVNIKNVTNDSGELNVIVGDHATNEGLTLNIENYSGTVNERLTVDGKAITALNFSGTNVYTQGTDCNIIISAVDGVAGTMTNKTGANTTIGGNVEIGETGETYTQNPTLVNENGATLTIKGGSTGLTNAGKVDNKGILEANSIGNDGTFENSGTLTADRLINGQSKSDAVFNSTADSFTVKESVTNSAIIKGVNASFGTYIGSGSNDQLTLSGDLTVTGEDGKEGPLGDAISNDGEITARNIEVKQGGVSNNGTITVSDEKSSTYGNFTVSNGGITNGTSSSITAQNVNASGDVENSSNIEAKGTLTVGGTLTANSDSSTKMAGGSLKDVTMNGGTVTNSGELSIGGTVTGSDGTIENSGELTLSGSGSGFTGTFTQTAGSTTVNSGGTLFGGEKNIQGGSSLTVSSDSMYSGVVNLSGGSAFDFTFSGSDGNITKDLLKFTSDDGGSANFTGNGADTVFTLNDDIEGEEYGSVTFKNSGLKLHKNADGQFKYKEFTLDNTTLKLGEEGSNTTDDFVFGKFNAKSGSKVDFDVKFGDDNTLITDSLTVGSGSSGTLELGNIFISDESNVENGGNYATQTDQGVLRGDGAGSGGLTLSGSETGVKGATTAFEYNINVGDDGKGITASVSGIADENSLYKMDSKVSGKRFFHFSTGDEKEYHIKESLKNTLDGEFTVKGKSNDRTESVLSGKLKEGEVLKDEKGSFFNITENGDPADKATGNVKLTVENLTVQDASSDKGGSVLHNESSKAKVVLDNLHIRDNTSTGGNGGAVYNNGGSGTDPSTEDFTGLYVHNVQFSGNSAKDNGNGGAIYNDESGYMVLDGVTTDAGSESAKNDIYNKGTTVTQGENTFGSLFTNEGNVTFNGTNTLSEFANSNGGNAYFNGEKAQIDKYTSTGGTLNFESGTNATLGTVIGDVDSSITNSGNLTLKGSGASYAGAFSQTAGTFTVDSSSTFFGGSSTVSGGVLNWFTNQQASAGTLNVSGDETVLNVGDANHTGTITFGSDSGVTAEVTTNIYDGSTLNVKGGDVTLSKGLWQGAVNLESGDLTLSSLKNGESGTLTATSGNLTLNNETELTLGSGSSIAKKVVTDIEEGTSVLLEQGELTLDSKDTWLGAVLMAGESTGKLTFDGYDDVSKGMGILAAFGGEVDILNGSNITLGGDNRGIIGDFVQATIDASSSVTLLEEGILVLDDADTWQGTVNLNGGELDYGMTKMDETAKLVATKGNLNLLSGSVLEIENDSEVDDKVSVDIQSGSTVDIIEGTFSIDAETSDKWNGLVKNEGGEFTATGIVNKGTGSGQFQQDSGKATFQGESDIVIGGDSYIDGGDVTVKGKSSLAFASGSNLMLDNLSVTESSKFGIMNGIAQTVTAGTQTVDESSDFEMDLNLRNGPSDKFIFDNLTGEGGNVNVSDFDFIGGAPVYRNVELQLFDVGENVDNVTFSATNKQVMTPIGEYGLTSLGAGRYLASLGRYNPKVFRGQVTTLAMYNNQLAIDDMLLNHVILQSQKNDSTRTANKYAAVNPLFAPYQYTREDGGLWYKAYVDIERLSMTQNLNVNNTAYGSLIGADLPLVHLKNGWDFIPTFFIGYNGSRQSYSDMNMYQNGGQGGFMGTFMKNDFIGSILAYGGGYLNEMNVEGFTDKTGNWFAGTAAKAAYNFHPSKHFIIQPTAMVAYNAFGKQSWGTDFGAMSMNSGMMNGISVAPGMNLIYARDTWSLYATFQYLFNINDHVGGHAGVDVNLPEVSMRHGYIQYGLGATKTFKERLNSYFQFVIRNGGRTGVGFQLGLEYLFDWNNIFAGKQSVKPDKKTVVKKTDDKVVPASDKTQKTKKVKQSKSTDPTKAVKQSKPSKNTKPAVNKSQKMKNDKVNSNKEIIVTPDGTKRTVIKELKK